MKIAPLITLTVIAALGLGVAAPRHASAAPATLPAARDGDLYRPVERIRDVLRDLHLTEKQKSEIEAVLVPFRKEVEAWRADHKADIEKVRAELKAARQSKDRAQVKAALADLKTLLETAPKPKAAIEAIRGILTREEWDKVKARLEEIRDRIEERRDRANATGA